MRKGITLNSITNINSKDILWIQNPIIPLSQIYDRDYFNVNNHLTNNRVFIRLMEANLRNLIENNPIRVTSSAI